MEDFVNQSSIKLHLINQISHENQKNQKILQSYQFIVYANDGIIGNIDYGVISKQEFEAPKKHLGFDCARLNLRRLITRRWVRDGTKGKAASFVLLLFNQSRV